MCGEVVIESHVGGEVKLSRNAGNEVTPAPLIADITIGGTLSCRQNGPAPVGGDDTAAAKTASAAPAEDRRSFRRVIPRRLFVAGRAGAIHLDLITNGDQVRIKVCGPTSKQPAYCIDKPGVRSRVQQH